MTNGLALAGGSKKKKKKVESLAARAAPVAARQGAQRRVPPPRVHRTHPVIESSIARRSPVRANTPTTPTTIRQLHPLSLSLSLSCDEHSCRVAARRVVLLAPCRGGARCCVVDHVVTMSSSARPAGSPCARARWRCRRCAALLLGRAAKRCPVGRSALLRRGPCRASAQAAQQRRELVARRVRGRARARALAARRCEGQPRGRGSSSVVPRRSPRKRARARERERERALAWEQAGREKGAKHQLDALEALPVELRLLAAGSAARQVAAAQAAGSGQRRWRGCALLLRLRLRRPRRDGASRGRRKDGA